MSAGGVLAAGPRHSLGLRADGTVLAAGAESAGECRVEGWREVVAVAAGGVHAAANTGRSHSVGLRADGTVLATGWDAHGQCATGDWRDVVAVAAGWRRTAGVREDGTVLPQVGAISSEVEAGTEPLVWSTISLDRVTRSIVMTEYRCDDSCDNYPTGTTRAVRFDFQEGGPTFAGTTTASEALEVPLHFLNGVGSHNGRWWFNSSRHKTLSYWSGEGALTTYPWVSWGQSLSYWEDADGPDLLWSLTEGEGFRAVFAVKQAGYS